MCTWKQGNTGCCVWVIVCIMLSKKVCGRVCSVLLVLNSTGCTECCGFAPNRMLRHTPAGSGRQLLWSHARPLRRLAVTAAMAPATPHPDILCTTAYVSTDYLWPQPQPTFVPAEHQPASAMAWLQRHGAHHHGAAAAAATAMACAVAAATPSIPRNLLPVLNHE